MSCLVLPPSPIRHRSSFTNIRPPPLKVELEAICSSRKRASSVSSVSSLPHTPTAATPQSAQSVLKSPRPTLSTVTSSSMLPGFVARSLQLFENSNHYASASTSYSDESVLPTSAPASPTHSTFGEIHAEKPSSSSSGFPSVRYFYPSHATSRQR